MPNLNLPLFFMSDPFGGWNWAPKEGWNSKFSIKIIHNYIDSNIFEDAGSESAIIFHVRPIWSLKLGPKWEVKFKVFDRNNSYRLWRNKGRNPQNPNFSGSIKNQYLVQKTNSHRDSGWISNNPKNYIISCDPIGYYVFLNFIIILDVWLY